MGKTNELNLQELFYAMINRIWLIVLSSVILGVLVYLYSANFITPKYRSSVTLYVNNTTEASGEISSSDLATAQRLVDTYVAILEQYDTMKAISDAVNEKLGKDYMTAEAIMSSISAGAINETEVFTITVTHTNPRLAKHIADAVGEVAPGVIDKIVEGSSAKVVSYARLPERPYAPNNINNAIYGAIAGALLAVAYIVIWILTDVRINSEEDLALISSAPVLGLIPNFDADEKSGYSYQKHEYSVKPKKEAGR